MERYKYASDFRRRRFVPLYRSADDICNTTENCPKHSQLLEHRETEITNLRERLELTKKELEQKKTNQTIPLLEHKGTEITNLKEQLELATKELEQERTKQTISLLERKETEITNLRTQLELKKKELEQRRPYQTIPLLEHKDTEITNLREQLELTTKELEQIRTNQTISKDICDRPSLQTTLTEENYNIIQCPRDLQSWETYDKLKGAADDIGQMYEVQMLTIVYLRCLGTGKPFKLASNYCGAGKFDDMVVYRMENLQQTCVQLKHRMRPIRAKEVLAFNGQFSVMEYFRSYRDEVKPILGENCELILYTNADMPIDLFHPQRIQTHLSTNENGYFVTFTKSDVDVYNLPNNIRDYKDFLENILRDLTEVPKEDHASVIQIRVNDFRLLNGGYLFSQKLISLKRSPTKHQVESLIYEVEKLGDLSLYYEFLEKFQVYYGQANESMLVAVIKEEVEKQTGVKVKDDIVSGLIERIKYWWRSDRAYFLKESDDIWFETIKDVFRQLSQSKLSQVTNLNICVKSDIVSELRDNITKSKFLHILVDGDCTLPAVCKVYQALGDNMSSYSTFMDLTEALKQRDCILGALNCRWGHVLVLEATSKTLMGVKEFFLALSEILVNNPHKRLIVITNVNDFVSTNNVRTIRDVIRVEWKDRTTLGDLTEETQNRVMDKKLIFQGYNVPLKTLITNHPKMKDYVNEGVIMKLLKDEVVSIGGELLEPIDYYIPRTLTRNGQSSFAESTENLTDRAVVIIGEPGMGKSTLLTYLSKMIKSDYHDLWVVRINLSEYSSFFDSICEPVDDKLIVKFLKIVLKIDKSSNLFLEKCLFKDYWQTSGRMALLLDGFDEICPTYETQVSSIISHLLLTGLKNMWITSRTMFQTVLETITNCKAFRLDSFQEEDQTLFLQTVWNNRVSNIHNDVLNSFITKVLELVSRSLNDVEKSFTGIPLQTMFIAEMFEENLREYQEKKINTLPVHIDLLEMYVSFFEKKSAIEVQGKKGFDTTKKGVREHCKHIDMKADEMYQMCSLVTLLSHSQLGRLHDRSIARRVSEFLNDPEQNIEMGVVHSVVDGKPIFLHRTFAEYFMGKWLSENYSKNQHLIKNLLHDTTFYMTLGFLNRVLAKDFKLHMAVINNDITTFKALLGTEDLELTDCGGRTALHLAAGFSSDENFTKLLLERHVERNKLDHIFNWTALMYADATQMLGSMELLLDTENEGTHDLNYTMEKMKDVNFTRPTIRVCCERGYEKCLSFIIKEGFSANLTLDDENFKPLHIVTKHGAMFSDKTERIIDLLLKSGADINATTIRGETPLHMLAESGELPLVMYLVERTMDETEEERQSGTERLMNVLNGKTDKVMCQKVMTQYRNEQRKTALQVASDHGYEHIVRYLTDTRFSIDGFLRTHHRSVDDPKMFGTIRFLVEERDAVVHAMDEYNKTLLHLAAKVADVSIVEYLIQKGAISVLNDENRHGPLHIAAYNGKLDILNYLVQEVRMDCNAVDVDGNTSFGNALAGNHIEIARALVGLGARTDHPDWKGRTILSDMCGRGIKDAVRYLIEECGYHPYQEHTYDVSPLHYACAEGHLDVAKYLISRKAPTNVLNRRGDYPLHLAAARGKLQIVKYLIEECGEHPDVRNTWSETALLKACESGFIDVVEYLTSLGAKPEIRDNEHNTPLHRAVKSGKLNIVTFIIDKLNVDPNCLGSDRMTPLHVASMHGHLDIVKHLIESVCVNILARTRFNKEALQLAKEYNHLNVVDYLSSKMLQHRT